MSAGKTKLQNGCGDMESCRREQLADNARVFNAEWGDACQVMVPQA
jgi:hypothetical protein